MDTNGAPWKLGDDVGFGFGWKLQIGSLTAFYSSYLNVGFYEFTDATGAVYRLSQNSNGIWTSTESVYVTYDSNAQRLYFNDGSFWVLGCTSAGTEQDAGTMYPTLLQDSNGNQIIIQYLAGAGLSWRNSSARIQTVQDVRLGGNPPGSPTFEFWYNSDPIPHLTNVGNFVNSTENFVLSYSGPTPVNSPFGSSSRSLGSTTFLNSINNKATSFTTNFSYDSGGAGELTQVTFPLGGYVRWVYGNAAYPQTTVREVVNRFLQWDTTIGERAYNFSSTHSGSNLIPTSRQLTDVHSGALKVWNFGQALGSTFGLVTSFNEGASSSPQNPLRTTNYTWAQNASGNNYISRLQAISDPGQSYSVTGQSDQTVDPYGNVTQSKLYDYSDLSNPTKTYNTTYLTSSGGTDYLALYIRNRVSTVTLTDKNGITTNLKQNTYDQYPNGIAPTPNVYQQDTQDYGPSFTSRGNLYKTALPWATWRSAYDQTGAPIWTGNDVNPNKYVSSTRSTNTNYAAPDMITTGNSLNTGMTWSQSLHQISSTGPNSDTNTTVYDSTDRPVQKLSPYGAATNTYYALYAPISAPQIYESVNGRTVKTYVDGLGRTARIEKSDSNSTQSVVETVYDSCGCSAMGKLAKQSMPHAPGTTPVWSAYTYDSLGRVLTMLRPDGQSSSAYAYAGNSVTITDPSGKWKQITRDAYGHIIRVEEPSPKPSSEPNHVTLYTYDTFGHLTQVQMSRTIGGSVRTQTRTWVYDPQTLQLLSKSSPESGTVSYTYNADGTPATATDAKNQRKVYTYDSYQRIVQTARGTVTNGTFVEDLTQRATYAYEGANGGFSSATAGRVSQVQYSGPHGLAFTEMYSYHPAGAVTYKRLQAAGTPFGTSSANMDAHYSYDNEGKVTSIAYPSTQYFTGNSASAGPTYNYSYDSMGRLSGLSDGNTNWVSGVTYGPANEMLQLVASTFTENRTYNADLELTELTSGSNVHYKYSYTSGQDNGQIATQTDVISGEVISYQYDSLQRLITASATGDPSGAWSQAFTYDGFGNLTQKNSTNAPALSVAVDSSTNRLISNASYDANGNMTGYAGATYSYDLRNRMGQASVSGGSVAYGYDSANHRIYKGLLNGTTYSAEEIYFYGVEGHKYGTWQINPSSGVLLQATATKQWFGGRLLVPQNQIASQGKYFAYGEERTTVSPANPANDQEKFATYTRDSATGLDYANQRYYSSTIGRFTRPDPYGESANAMDPQSWNRYTYAGNDPANANDPTGLFLVDCVWDGCSHGGGGGGGGNYTGSYSSNPGLVETGPLADLQQQSQSSYQANLQQTTTDIQDMNAANQALAAGNPAAAAGIAAANPDVVAVPVAPTTTDPVYNAFAGLASSLGVDPNANIEVKYQQLGTATSVQAINPDTSAPYQMGDLSFDPGAVGTADPSLISAMFHGRGNPSWYIGSGTNALHIVDLQTSQGLNFQPGLQWHVDAYNPMYGLPNMLQHLGTEVIPGKGVYGLPGKAICSVNGGCQ